MQLFQEVVTFYEAVAIALTGVFKFQLRLFQVVVAFAVAATNVLGNDSFCNNSFISCCRCIYISYAAILGSSSFASSSYNCSSNIRCGTAECLSLSIDTFVFKKAIYFWPRSKKFGQKRNKTKNENNNSNSNRAAKKFIINSQQEKSSFKSLEFLLGPNFRRPETISLLCFRQIIFNQFYQKQFGNEAIDHYITKCDQIVAQCLRNEQRH